VSAGTSLGLRWSCAAAQTILDNLKLFQLDVEQLPMMLQLLNLTDQVADAALQKMAEAAPQHQGHLTHVPKAVQQAVGLPMSVAMHILHAMAVAATSANDDSSSSSTFKLDAIGTSAAAAAALSVPARLWLKVMDLGPVMDDLKAVVHSAVCKCSLVPVLKMGIKVLQGQGQGQKQQQQQKAKAASDKAEAAFAQGKVGLLVLTRHVLQLQDGHGSNRDETSQ